MWLKNIAKPIAIKKVACPDGKAKPVSGKSEDTCENNVKGLGVWIINFKTYAIHQAVTPEKNTKAISFHFCLNTLNESHISISLEKVFEDKTSWWKSKNITDAKTTRYGKVSATKIIVLSKKTNLWDKL